MTFSFLKTVSFAVVSSVRFSIHKTTKHFFFRKYIVPQTKRLRIFKTKTKPLTAIIRFVVLTLLHGLSGF